MLWTLCVTCISLKCFKPIQIHVHVSKLLISQSSFAVMMVWLSGFSRRKFSKCLHVRLRIERSGPEVIKLCSRSTQLSVKF